MNVTEDTIRHIIAVRLLLDSVITEINQRAIAHDASKLESPEKEMFEIWRPRLDELSVDSHEYKEALAQMGEGLAHHYRENRHHPEHFKDGIRGMNLIDLLEMVCDWEAAAARKGQAVSMEWASKRFGISKDDHIYSIIQNTLDLF